MLAIVAIGLSGLALILNIVGLAIPYWVYISSDVVGVTIKSYYGLWTQCTPTILPTENVCISIPVITGVLKATRACEILGVLVIAGALACAILKQFAMKEQKLLPKIGGGCAIGAGALMIIGSVIFGTDKDNTAFPGSTLHAGFALCIVAGVIAIVSGIIMFIASKDE